MLRRYRRWVAIACFAAWALGPAVGMGLAIHELEHHGHELREHSHAARAAEAFLHGHLHEEGAEEHRHELAPPSFTPSRRGLAGQLALATLGSAGPAAQPQGALWASGAAPGSTTLAAPDLLALCVLRL